MCRVCKDEIYVHILILIFFENMLLYPWTVACCNWRVELLSEFLIGRIWRDTLIREIGGSFNAVRFSVFGFVGWLTNRSLHHLHIYLFLLSRRHLKRSRFLSQRLLLTWSASSLATRCIFISSSGTLGDALPNTGVTRWPRHMLAAERRCDLSQVQSSSWKRGFHQFLQPRSILYLG